MHTALDTDPTADARTTDNPQNTHNITKGGILVAIITLGFVLITLLAIAGIVEIPLWLAHRIQSRREDALLRQWCRVRR